MDAKKGKELLDTILDLGASLIQTGADTNKTEVNLYRICAGYGFQKCNIWVVPSNIQASVTTPEGEDITLIRHIRSRSTDYTRLADLNDLARRIAADPLEPEKLRETFAAIQSRQEKPEIFLYLAGILGGLGFGVFFGCGALDAIVAGCASFLVAFLGQKLARYEKNQMVYNFVLSFLAEVFIILAVHTGVGKHIGYISIGIVMLLISGLGVTTGIKDFLHQDTLSGVIRISDSLSGAIGIAFGVGLPLFLFQSAGESEVIMLNPSVLLQLIFCTVGCAGFALWFKVKWQHIAPCALGALLTWAVFLLAREETGGSFTASFIAAVICAAYSQIMARVCGAPAVIFNSVSVFPLIPGAALYYTMFGIVTGSIALAREQGISLISTCFAIVLGMMVVEVIVRSCKSLLRR